VSLVVFVGSLLCPDVGHICHQHSMLWPQVSYGEDGLQIWKVAVNILNKESWAVGSRVIVQLWSWDSG
jgi:hypothetical protein